MLAVKMIFEFRVYRLLLNINLAFGREKNNHVIYGIAINRTIFSYSLTYIKSIGDNSLKQ